MSEALLKVAAAELGTAEIRGPEHNPSILRYAQEVGLVWIEDDETPWCSIFLNWCAKRAGLERSGSPRARSWLEVGTRVSPLEVEPGDIAVLQRGGLHAATGHVGVYLGHSSLGGQLWLLGGNQGNRVSVATFACDLVLPGGYRRLGPADPVPRVPMAIGGHGPHVKQLQRVLARLGHDPGPIDGVFGLRTASALSAAQAEALGHGLARAEQPPGHYGVAAESALRGLLKLRQSVPGGTRAPA